MWVHLLSLWGETKSVHCVQRGLESTQHAVNSTHVSSWPRVELTLVKSTRGQLDRVDSCEKSKMQRKNKRRRALHKITLTITLSNLNMTNYSSMKHKSHEWQNITSWQFCKLHNQQQQALPKINVKICRCSQIVPNLLRLKLSRLNDAITASRSWQLRVEHRVCSTLLCKQSQRKRRAVASRVDLVCCRTIAEWFLEKGDMICTSTRAASLASSFSRRYKCMYRLPLLCGLVYLLKY